MQRAVLLELEARQEQLKKLCEDALKEDEEQQQLIQKLEERSFLTEGGGPVTNRGLYSNTYNALMAPPLSQGSLVPPISSQSSVDMQEDLLTGEVRSFRDPDSIARASSVGSVGPAAFQRSSSRDRPFAMAPGGYRPPTYPTSMPPVRPTLYSSLPMRSVPGPSIAGINRTPFRESPINDESPSPATGGSVVAISGDWRQPSGSTELAGSAGLTNNSRLPPPPPPPPHSWEESPRTPSYHAPLLRKIESHRQAPYAARPPPPPPPMNPISVPSPKSNRAMPPPPPPAAPEETRLPVAQRRPPPPPPLAALVPPYVTADLPPPPPSPPLDRYAAPPREEEQDEGRAAAPTSIWSSFHPISPKPTATAPPPPPPPPPSLQSPAADEASDIESKRSSFSYSAVSKRALRWSRPQRESTASLRRYVNERARDRRESFRLAPAYATASESLSYARKDPASARLPPPPPSPSIDEDEVPNRWELSSMTSSHRRAEEVRLRHYFSQKEPSPYYRRTTAGTLSRQTAKVRKAPPRPPIPSMERAPRGLTGSRQLLDTAAASTTTTSAVPAVAVASSTIPPVLTPSSQSRKLLSSSLHPYGDQQDAVTLPSPSVQPPQRMKTVLGGTATAAVMPLRASLLTRCKAATGLNSSHPSVGGGVSSRNDGETIASNVSDISAPPTPGHTNASVRQLFFDAGPEEAALRQLLHKKSVASHENELVKKSLVPSNSQGPLAPTSSNLKAKTVESGNSAETAVELNRAHSFFNTSPVEVVPVVVSSTSTQMGLSLDNGAVQQKLQATQNKAETLARHLVKAINERQMLQENVEQMEELVEECNLEVGRLQAIVEAQHKDATTSLGVQAALRAKEREVAIYEDEIKRLQAVLESHLTRTKEHDLAAQGLLEQRVELDAAMSEVGAAHLAQREAEERAKRLSSELDTAVEQIQYLDERLAEMERAAAAAKLQDVRAVCLPADKDHRNVMQPSLSSDGAVPSVVESQKWPLGARHTIEQLVSQSEQLLWQNTEGTRHASNRLQYIEKTCDELRKALLQRAEEAQNAEEECLKLRHEKQLMQACSDQWYQQLQGVKRDAQLVSEMVCTSREDAEDVYYSCRLADGRAEDQLAAVAMASPFLSATTSTPTAGESATIKKTVHFARQVMQDFHAVARFLASLREMHIGDRNGYQILHSLAKGSAPAEGLYISTDDADTPIRLRPTLTADVTETIKRRVKERKQQVVEAVEYAFKSSLAAHQPQWHEKEVEMGSSRVLVEPHADNEADECVIADELEEVELKDEFVHCRETERDIVSSAIDPARMGSSYRQGSNGIVNSDVRHSLPEVPFSPKFNGTEEAVLQTASGRVFCSAVSMGQNLQPTLSSGTSHSAEGLPPTGMAPLGARVAAMSYSPPPSVSRPLRLSATPSQPQVEEEKEFFIAPSAPREVLLPETPPQIHVEAKLRSVDTSASTNVSSPSLLSQAMHPQMLHSAVAAAPPVTIPEREVTTISLLSASDIPSDCDVSRPLAETTVETDVKGGQSATWHSTDHDSASPVLRASPLLPNHVTDVSDGPLKRSHSSPDLITSPLEQPRPSVHSAADEPPPRTVSEDGRHSLSARPKDRSTTARPPSPVIASRGHLEPRGSARRNPEEWNDGEVAPFFRVPPRGEVQEVVLETGTSSDPAATTGEGRVVVNLLHEGFLLPSSVDKPSQWPASLKGATRHADPQHCHDDDTAKQEQQSIQRHNLSVVTGTLEVSPLSTSVLSSQPPRAAPDGEEHAGPRTKGKEHRKHHYSPMDEDDEPCLSFSAPPPSVLPADTVAASRSSSPDVTPLGEKNHSDDEAAPVESTVTRSISPLGHNASASSRPLHQPRRPARMDDAPGPVSGVALPRLQRSSGSSPTPSIALPLHVAKPAPLKQSSSTDSPSSMLPAETPALAEPQRPLQLQKAAASVVIQSVATPRALPAEVVIEVDDADLLLSTGKSNSPQRSSSRRLPSITSTAPPASPDRPLLFEEKEKQEETAEAPALQCDSPPALSLPHTAPVDTPPILQSAMSQPADPLPVAPSKQQWRTVHSGGGARGSPRAVANVASPPPLPRVNDDPSGATAMFARPGRLSNAGDDSGTAPQADAEAPQSVRGGRSPSNLSTTKSSGGKATPRSERSISPPPQSVRQNGTEVQEKRGTEESVESILERIRKQKKERLSSASESAVSRQTSPQDDEIHP